MLVKDLIDSARAEANDRTMIVFTDDVDLLRYLNEAVDEACIRKDLLYEATDEKMCKIQVDAGQQVYLLPERWRTVVRASLARDADPLCQPDLRIRSREELALDYPGWQANERRKPPYAITIDDRTIEVAGLIEDAGIISLQGYRLPLKALKGSSDKPEISDIHHRFLTQWMLHRMYAVPDSEIFNQDKSAKAEAAFTAYFGPRPDANMRKNVVADRVHRNRSWY